MKRNLRALLLIVLVAIIVGVLLGVFLPGGDDEEDRLAAIVSSSDQPTPAKIQKEPAPVTEATPAEESTPAEDGQPVRAQEEPSIARAAPEEVATETPPAPAPDVIKPSFDVVRVSPSGRAVIAGRAEPGAEVTVLDGGIPLGSVFADERGEWVLLPEDSLAGGDRELSLVQDTPDGVRVQSEQVVVLSVPVPRRKPDAASPAGSETVPIDDTAQDITVAQNQANEANEGVIAVLVERDGDGPSRVLQGPEMAGDGIGEELEVTIRSIDYDSEGAITLAGRTEPNAVVNVYVDGEYIGSAEANVEGDWQLSPEKEVPPGRHRLRVDKVDVEGIVLARIETPISRANPEELLLGDALVVVQPGNSLWRIARRAYGGGVYYTEIYGANSAQILDPNMIFPGQILSLPVLN